MFGWEFPPHISGGLGTACFGLTQSLHKLGVDVVFVVPKLHGDEPGDVEIINASNIEVDQHELNNFNEITANHVSETQELKAIQQRILIEQKSTLEYIEVPSTLSPYYATHFEDESVSITNWNYELNQSSSYTLDSGSDVETTKTKTTLVTEKKIYSFSGSYGPKLIEETDRYALVAAAIAKQYTYDVIHAHDWMTYPAGIAAKEVSGKPLIVHVHATEYDRAGDNMDPYIFATEQYGMQKADMVFTVSARTKKIVVTRYNIPESKIRVVYNGIIPKEETSVVPSFVPKLGAQVVTFLGRVTHQKGPQYFVEAARLILKEFPQTHFIMAGSGDLLPQIIERVAQLRLSTHFHFTGFLKGQQVEKIWAMTDTYVMPSVSEPFGIAPLEAIQGGVPVVLSKQSGVSEVMPHAIKVDFWDVQALANAIGSILKYKSLADTLKQNSKAEIEMISWDNVAKKINHLYHEATGK